MVVLRGPTNQSNDNEKKQGNMKPQKTQNSPIESFMAFK